MSDTDKPSEPMTDEAIEHLVSLVEAAERYGKVMGLGASDGMRALLKACQIMTHLQRQGATVNVSSLAAMVAKKAD